MVKLLKLVRSGTLFMGTDWLVDWDWGFTSTELVAIKDGTYILTKANLE